MCAICQREICPPRCPNADYRQVGSCAQCRTDITSDEEYYTDDSGNIFCDMDCAMDYYGIKSVWED